MYTRRRNKGGLSQLSESKNEKVPKGIQCESSNKYTESSGKLASTIGALASPKMGDGTRCPKW